MEENVGLAHISFLALDVSVRIRVLNYNIHKGRAFFSRKKTWEILKELIPLVDADIVFLQEFLREPEAETMLEMIADKLWPHHSFGQNATAGDYHYGNAILSKFPFISTHNTNITNHYLEKRGLLYAHIQPQAHQDLHLFCTHLDLREQGRRQQLEKIEKVFQSIVPQHAQAILAGDFNDWNEKLDPHVCARLELQEAFKTINGKLQPSSPSIFPVFSLDRIYYKNLSVKTCAALNDRSLRYGSDHLPLVVELELLPVSPEQNLRQKN